MAGKNRFYRNRRHVCLKTPVPFHLPHLGGCTATGNICDEMLTFDSFISSSCGKCFLNSINDKLRRDESCGKDDALIGSFSLCTINRLKHGTNGDVGIIDCEIEGGLFGCEKISSSLFGELLDLRFAILMD